MVADIAALVVAILTAGGLIGTWVRNGNRQSREWGALKRDLEHLHEEIQDDNHGLDAIKRAVDEQKLHCAAISTELSIRVERAEKDINSIKNQ